MESILKHALSILNSTVVLGTLLASLLLLSGYSFNLGSFAAFGLSADAIPLSFSDSVAASFYMGVILVAKLWSNELLIWLPAALPFAVVGVLLIMVIVIRCSGLLDRLAAWDNKRKVERQSEGFNWLRVQDGLYDVFKKATTWAFALMMLATVPILVAVAPFKYGLSQGEKLVESFGDIPESCQGLLDHQKACYSVINLESGEVITRGGLVIGTADYIALYNGALTQVYRRSDDLVLQINKPADDKQ